MPDFGVRLTSMGLKLRRYPGNIGNRNAAGINYIRYGYYMPSLKAVLPSAAVERAKERKSISVSDIYAIFHLAQAGFVG